MRIGAGATSHLTAVLRPLARDFNLSRDKGLLTWVSNCFHIPFLLGLLVQVGGDGASWISAVLGLIACFALSSATGREFHAGEGTLTLWRNRAQLLLTHAMRMAEGANCI